MKINRLLLLLLSVSLTTYAQKVKKIEPPNWWVGMNHNQVELLVYGDEIATYTPSISNEFIKLKEIKKTENKAKYIIN
mgnify:FL=1